MRRMVQGPMYQRYEAHMWRLSVVPPSRRYRWHPPTNAYEVEGGGLVVVEVAGLQEDDFDVSFEDGRLTVSGMRREPESAAPVACHQMEIASGGFRSDVNVSWPVDAERITVSYRNGFIHVFLPELRGGPR
jgi:HSP20 family protein